MWVANRHDTEPINGTDYGSITREVGLAITRDDAEKQSVFMTYEEIPTFKEAA